MGGTCHKRQVSVGAYQMQMQVASTPLTCLPHELPAAPLPPLACLLPARACCPASWWTRLTA